MKYIKLFEERLRDYEILTNSDDGFLVDVLKKEIEKEDYDIDYIRDLVTYGHFDIDAMWNEGDTQWFFLMKATYWNKVDIIKTLLDGGADPNLQSDIGLTALMLAVRFNHLQSIQELLKHPKINPNLKDGYGSTALMDAVKWRSSQAVQELLKHPAIDITIKDLENNILLSIVFKSKNTKIISEFLKKFKDNIDDVFLLKIIMCYIDNDLGDDIFEILTDECDINIYNILNYIDSNNDSILMMAIKKGSVNFIKAFLENTGIYINYQYKNNSTALIMAIEYERPDIVRLLLQYPTIDPNVERWGGMNGLMIATINNDTESVRLLLAKSITDINADNYNGYTALHYSMALSEKGYRYDIIELLLNEPSIDKEITNLNDETAWDLADDTIRERFPELNPNAL